jgi:myosin heavy subunit
MGVLESIKVKQENFPYRRKHEDFYRIYELLSSEYSNGRYDLMNPNQRSSKNWSDLCLKIIQKAFLPLGVEEYSSKFAVGRTKVMMMPETKTVLDKCKEIASFKYDDYSRIVKRAYMLQKAKKAIDHKMT